MAAHPMEGPAFAAENILRLPFALRPWLSQVASIVACTNRARSLCSQRTSGVGVLGSDTAALPRGQASFPQASRCGLCGEQWGGSGDQAIREVQRRPPSLCRMAGSRGPTVHTLGLPMLPGPPGHLEMREKQQHSIQRPPPPPPPAGALWAPSSLSHPPIRLGGPALSWWRENRKQRISTGRVPPRQYSSPFPKPSLAGFLRYTSCGAVQLRKQALPFQDLLCGVLYPRAVPAAFRVLFKAKTVGRLLQSLGHGP